MINVASYLMFIRLENLNIDFKIHFISIRETICVGFLIFFFISIFVVLDFFLSF